MRKLLASFLAVGALAGGVFTFTTAPAGAASMTTVAASLHRLSGYSNDIAAAAGDGDEDAVTDACSALGDEVSNLGSMSRPRYFPKVAWRHLMAYTSIESDAIDACLDGDYGTAATLTGQATGELKTANRLM